MKLIDAADVAGEGDVFGFETVSEEKRVFSQFQFTFQDDLPVSYARYSLNLPAGWRADSVTFNRGKVEPGVWRQRDSFSTIESTVAVQRKCLKAILIVQLFAGHYTSYFSDTTLAPPGTPGEPSAMWAASFTRR